MKPAELKKRWSSSEAVAFVTSFLNDLARGRPIESSPFGKIDGRIDLRGLPIPSDTRVHAVKGRSVDLSYATLAGVWIEACSFEDVAFDDAVAADIADHGNQFSECSFARTSFRGAALGYRGSRFASNRFVEADFRGAIFIRPEIDDCEFDRCRFDGVDFKGASFRRTKFSGEVKDVWFRGGFALEKDKARLGTPRPNFMEGVSFENARLSGVTFSNGCGLETVLLPLDASCHRFSHWKARLERLLDFAASRPSTERKEVEIFCRVHLVHAPGQDWYIVSTVDLRHEHGAKAAALIIEELRRYTPS